MKHIKLSLILLLFISLIFTSCKDEDTTPTDKIEAQLSASKTAYNNAADGAWILITEAEYSALTTRLASVSKVGTTDNFFTNTDNHEINGGGFTWSNNNSVTMPSGSYLFAFKYLSNTDQTITNSRVKVSTTGRYAGLANFGTALPSHAGGTNYFVIKNSNIPIASGSTGYLAMYFSETSTYWYAEGSDEDVIMQWSIGNATTTPNTSNGILLYQGLSTTEKQWD